jgi:hypothetical protein
LFNSRKWKSRPGANNIVYCNNGTAKVIPGDPLNTFRCNNVDFYDFVSHADLGSQTGEGSSSWGWTSPDGREFVAIAQADGAAFAEINHQGKLVYLGRLPQSPEAEPSIWREIRGYKSYLVVGSEATNHGVQIFDMSKVSRSSWKPLHRASLTFPASHRQPEEACDVQPQDRSDWLLEWSPRRPHSQRGDQ